MQVHLFDNESALREVIGKIVVPNLQIRETDEERFEDEANHTQPFYLTKAFECIRRMMTHSRKSLIDIQSMQ